MSLSLRGVPVPLLFVAGAAFGVLFASLVVLCTHSRPTAKSTTAMIRPTAIVAPDPMFDTPPAVEPASPSARPPAPAPARPVVKKAVTHTNVRRHHRPAGKPAATGDLLTAAL